MVMPVTKRGEDSVDRILDATLILLERNGFSQLTTNHIAAESGVKVGSFYRFFPNKEAVIVALLERWFNSIMDTTERYLANNAPGSTFTELIQGLFLVNLESEYIHSVAYQEIFQGASTVPVLGQHFARHQQRIVKSLVKVYTGEHSGISEFCVFLHEIISSALATVASKKGAVRTRQSAWVCRMIKGAVEGFEQS
ncbi:MAG: TetR/AcrR family transcriptional regulator [Gammaproteobacteria bacterium]|nr:TetR/AcrR family transcriptional regulator [Gammaproteobacteria bacterium]